MVCGGQLELRVLQDEFVALHGVLHRDQQFLAQPRLDDEPVDFAFVDRINHRVEAEHGSDQNARGVGLDLARLREQLETGQARHALIGDDDRERAFLQFRKRDRGIARGDDLVMFAPQRFLQREQHDFLVVDHEDAR